MSSVRTLTFGIPVDLAGVKFEVPAVYVVNISVSVIVDLVSGYFECIDPHVLLKVFVVILYRSVENSDDDFAVSTCELAPYILDSDVGTCLCSGCDHLVADIDEVPLVFEECLFKRKVFTYVCLLGNRLRILYIKGCESIVLHLGHDAHFCKSVSSCFSTATFKLQKIPSVKTIFPEIFFIMCICMEDLLETLDFHLAGQL